MVNLICTRKNHIDKYIYRSRLKKNVFRQTISVSLNLTPEYGLQCFLGQCFPKTIKQFPKDTQKPLQLSCSICNLITGQLKAVL